MCVQCGSSSTRSKGNALGKCRYPFLLLRHACVHHRTVLAVKCPPTKSVNRYLIHFNSAVDPLCHICVDETLVLHLPRMFEQPSAPTPYITTYGNDFAQTEIPWQNPQRVTNKAAESTGFLWDTETLKLCGGVHVCTCVDIFPVAEPVSCQSLCITECQPTQGKAIGKGSTLRRTRLWQRKENIIRTVANSFMGNCVLLKHWVKKLGLQYGSDSIQSTQWNIFS